MKHVLRLKFLIGYFCVLLAAFILIATLGSRLVYSSLEQKAIDRLYQSCSLVATTYSGSSSERPNRLQLEAIASSRNCDVWIINQENTLLTSVGTDTAPESIPSFHPYDGVLNRYMAGDFYGCFDQTMISVYQPLIRGTSTLGYVITHYPVSLLERTREQILLVAYLTLAGTMILALGLLILFEQIVSKPVGRITRAAKEYAAGNLTYQPNVKAHDEMGYLANTLSDMALRLNNIGEDQHKFVANVSHDFRSPLTSIKGYLEAILDGTIPPELQEKYLGIVLGETERLTKLTQSLLTLNSFDTKGIYLEQSNFDINTVIRDILATFEGRCKDKKITFELTFSDTKQVVYADKSRIQQVLYNLIDNAIKFSNPDSVINIDTSVHHEKLFISVKDHGVGIPKESLGKIWERFYKTDTSRGKDKKGTGLGLSIVKEIIQAHKENIDVISTEGVGTEFIFSLPMAEEKESITNTWKEMF